MSYLIKIGPVPKTPGFTFGTSGTVSAPLILESIILPAPKKIKLKPGAALKPAITVKAAASEGKLIRKKAF